MCKLLLSILYTHLQSLGLKSAMYNPMSIVVFLTKFLLNIAFSHLNLEDYWSIQSLNVFSTAAFLARFEEWVLFYVLILSIILGLYSLREYFFVKSLQSVFELEFFTFHLLAHLSIPITASWTLCLAAWESISTDQMLKYQYIYCTSLKFSVHASEYLKV